MQEARWLSATHKALGPHWSLEQASIHCRAVSPLAFGLICKHISRRLQSKSLRHEDVKQPSVDGLPVKPGRHWHTPFWHAELGPQVIPLQAVSQETELPSHTFGDVSGIAGMHIMKGLPEKPSRH